MTTRKTLLPRFLSCLMLPLCAAGVMGISPSSHAAPPDPDRVTMDLGEFLELWDRSRDPKKPEIVAPRDYTISSARYTGEVLMEDGDPRSALFTGRFRIEALKKEGWVRVPVLPATVALQSATIAGKEAPVVIEDGFYTLVTDRRGSIDLKLEFGASVSTAEGSSQVEFQLAGSGATEVDLSVPADDDLDFTVANAHLQSDEVVGKRRKVNATLPSTGSLSIRWQREIPQAAVQDAQVYAETYTLVSVGDGLVRAQATINHTILFAGRDKLSAKIPAGMAVVDVTGNGIRDWKVGTDGRLDVLLNYAAEGAYALGIVMEKVVKESAELGTPIVEPLDVKRAKGWVGIESRGNLEVAAAEVKDASKVDVRSLPGSILGITDQPVLLGFKYLGETATIPLEIDYHEDVDVLVTLLDQVQARTMWTLDGRRLTSVKYQVRNNRKQFLRLSLPKGAELWSASVGGRAVQPAKADDGRVLIPLVRSQAAGGALAAFEVEVVYVESTTAVPDNGKGSFAGTLPTADAPSTYVAWTIYAPPKTKVRKRSVDGSLEHVSYLSNPIPQQDQYEIQTVTPQVEQQAAAQTNAGSMGQGAVPVPVSLPLQGVPFYFEKLVALDEDLTVEFDYRGLRH